jgi:hypothetical protein
LGKTKFCKKNKKFLKLSEIRDLHLRRRKLHKNQTFFEQFFSRENLNYEKKKNKLHEFWGNFSLKEKYFLQTFLEKV